jgi:hypothetical protein
LHNQCQTLTVRTKRLSWRGRVERARSLTRLAVPTERDELDRRDLGRPIAAVLRTRNAGRHVKKAPVTAHCCPSDARATCHTTRSNGPCCARQRAASRSVKSRGCVCEHVVSSPLSESRFAAVERGNEMCSQCQLSLLLPSRDAQFAFSPTGDLYGHLVDTTAKTRMRRPSSTDAFELASARPRCANNASHCDEPIGRCSQSPRRTRIRRRLGRTESTIRIRTRDMYRSRSSIISSCDSNFAQDTAMRLVAGALDDHE